MLQIATFCIQVQKTGQFMDNAKSQNNDIQFQIKTLFPFNDILREIRFGLNGNSAHFANAVVLHKHQHLQVATLNWAFFFELLILQLFCILYWVVHLLLRALFENSSLTQQYTKKIQFHFKKSEISKVKCISSA